MKQRFAKTALALCLGCAWVGAQAIDYYDLTSGTATTGVITAGGYDGAGYTDVKAIFTTDPNRFVVGTGVFDPFIRIGADNSNATNSYNGANCANGENCIEVGYNTDGSTKSKLDLQFQEKDSQGSNWNHTIATSTLQTVNIDGIVYYAFKLDINERTNSDDGGLGDKYLSLDQVRIFTSDSSTLEGYCYQGSLVSAPNVAGSGTYDPKSHTLGDESCINAPGTDPNTGLKAVFDMDLTGGSELDRSMALDYKQTGSGSGMSVDMFMYVEASKITGDYVYLFSSFGEMGQVAANTLTDEITGNKIVAGDFSQSDGYEEWSSVKKTPVVPTLALLGIGLVAMRGMRKFRPTIRFA